MTVDRGCLHKFVIAAAIGGALAVVAGTWVYEEKWPSTLDDREIARIGIPISGSHPIGHRYTAGGSVLCVDTCLVRARSYSAVGSLGTLVDDARRHLSDKGYRGQTQLVCSQIGPLARAPSPYWLFCSFSARRGKFTATITVSSYWPTPFGSPVRPPTSSGAVRVPLPSLSATRGNSESVAVEVGY